MLNCAVVVCETTLVVVDSSTSCGEVFASFNSFNSVISVVYATLFLLMALGRHSLFKMGHFN